MKSLKQLNEKIRYELHLEAEDEEQEDFIPDDFSEEEPDDSDEPYSEELEPVNSVIMRINNHTKMSANIKNLEFEVYYADLARKLTKDERLDFTYTKQKARALFQVILEEMGFFKNGGEENNGEE